MCVLFPIPIVYSRSELLSPTGTSPVILFSTEQRLKGQISQGKWSGLHSSLESALLGPLGGLCYPRGLLLNKEESKRTWASREK